MTASLVPAEEVPFIWDEVAPHLEKAVKASRGKYEMSDALELVLFGQGHLWIGYDDETKQIDTAAITHFLEYPRKKVLFCLFVGSKAGTSCKDEMIAILKDWAHDNGCSTMEGIGRPGWSKYLKHYGGNKVSDLYEFDIEEY